MNDKRSTKSKSRTYSYCIVNPDTGDEIRTVTASQIYKEYGIRCISRVLSLHSEDGPYLLPDGNTIVESRLNDETFKKVEESQHFQYFASNKGYIMEIDKKTRKRKVMTNLKSINGELFFETENGNKHSLPITILNTFISKLPSKFSFVYSDGDATNCDIDNLFIVLPGKRVD